MADGITLTACRWCAEGKCICDTKEGDYKKAMMALLDALDHHSKWKDEKNPDGLPLLDEVWYAKEMAEYVRQGSTWKEAGGKFVDT